MIKVCLKHVRFVFVEFVLLHLCNRNRSSHMSRFSGRKKCFNYDTETQTFCIIALFT